VPDTPPFEVLTTPTPAQRRALDLIERIGMQTETGTPDYWKNLATQGKLA
jgi:hypothetical protein